MRRRIMKNMMKGKMKMMEGKMKVVVIKVIL